MTRSADPVLELPFDAQPDPDAFVKAAMEWHFDPQTGSPFWLERAKRLDFDPRADVRSFDDLALFPNVAAELREVPARDLVPRGYGERPAIAGVFESGGTTGAPKRVVILQDWCDKLIGRHVAGMEARGLPRNAGWLALMPSGPHAAGDLPKRQVAASGGISFTIDMDPRWAKKLIADSKLDEADRYAEHLIDQAAFVLRTQDIGVLSAAPPLLERLARREELVELVREKVQAILWGGAHMDADTRHLYRTVVFPGVRLHGNYGSTMILGGADERPRLGDDDPCVFDTFAPYITFRVVDPESGDPVPYGERGQVVMSHVSKSFLLPNNLERDLATRVRPPAGQLVGDSVADVAPVREFEGETVIEGVY